MSRFDVWFSKVLFCAGWALFATTSISCLPLWAQAPANYVLKWQGTFDGSSLDTTTWWYRGGMSNFNGNLGAQVPENVSLDGKGHVDIANRKQSFAGASYTGGGIISQVAFRYGYYEITAKTPADSGWHTAFWLNSAGASSWTEIDGFEINSQRPRSVSMGLLTWVNGRLKPVKDVRCNGSYDPGFDTSVGMHTYGIEWTEQKISYYIDGAQVCTQRYSPTQGTHALVNIWLSSIADLSPVTSPAGAQAVFERARYYVRDYYVNAEETGYIEYGDGWENTSVIGYSGLGVRSSCQKNAVALYTPNLLTAATYDVQIYRVASPGDHSMAVVTVNHSGSQHASTTDLPAGPSGWADLGAFRFAADSSANVEIAHGSGCLLTSMVKFVLQPE
jgi:beta-glucanase (GH16 family)